MVPFFLGDLLKPSFTKVIGILGYTGECSVNTKFAFWKFKLSGGDLKFPYDYNFALGEACNV